MENIAQIQIESECDATDTGIDAWPTEKLFRHVHLAHIRDVIRASRGVRVLVTTQSQW